jgi:glycosyltransferase involved in cell wall biosynthesis
MRIALVSQEYPPETGSGGIGSQASEKARGLAARGHDVYVISHATSGTRYERFQDNVHVIRIPGFDEELPIATDSVRWLTYSMRVAAEIAALNSHVSLDLVEFPEWGGEGYIHLLNQTDWNRIPSVIHLHGPVVMFAHTIGWPDAASEFFRTARIMEETCLRLADTVFSSSRCSAEWCARHYGLDAESIPVLHTGVDTRVFRPLGVPKAKRPTIVFVGRIEQNKGVGILVEAGCRLAASFPDLRVQLIGKGSRAAIDELVDAATAAGHPDLIEPLGYIARDQLPEYLSRAHVFAAPSVYEGGPGFVYLEAMACGLPVIACSGSGATEIVEHGETGLLVRPHEVESLHGALSNLLSDAELRTRIGDRASEYVQREANSEDCLRRLESFYCEVIESCRISPEHV